MHWPVLRWCTNTCFKADESHENFGDQMLDANARPLKCQGVLTATPGCCCHVIFRSGVFIDNGKSTWQNKRKHVSRIHSNKCENECGGCFWVSVGDALTPWCRVLPEQLTGLLLVKKFPAFHGTRRFITPLTSVRHLSLSWASPIQSIHPHPTSWRSILILSTRLRLGLPSGLLPSGFPPRPYTPPLSSPIRATCPAHLILDFITRTILGEEYKS